MVAAPPGVALPRQVLPPLALCWHCCFCSHTANQMGELIWLENLENCLFFFFLCARLFSAKGKNWLSRLK